MPHTLRIVVLGLSALVLAACAQHGGQTQDGSGQDTYKVAKSTLGLPSGEHVVYFNTGSAELTTEELQKLMLTATKAKGASAKVVVSGHTDGTGTSEKNEALSAARAKAVADLLISAGVKAEQIQAKHCGDSRPAVESKTGRPAAKNRRVEFLILKRANE